MSSTRQRSLGRGSAEPRQMGEIIQAKPWGDELLRADSACAVSHAACSASIALLLAVPAAIRAEIAAEPDATLDRVEVVGSRIKRVDVETAQPVLVIERAQLEATGRMSVGDILQNLTIHGAALNTGVNNGGDGTTRVDLRNLGSNARWCWSTGVAGYQASTARLT